MEAAWKAGIVLVVAAGNNGRDNSKGTQGYGTITAPGNDPYVITTYSSKGPAAIDRVVKPDLVAPQSDCIGAVGWVHIGRPVSGESDSLQLVRSSWFVG